MALYLGSNKKLKASLGGIAVCLNIVNAAPSISAIRLLSSDNYILKDSMGVYLIPKIEIQGTMLTTVDDYILQDLNGLYLTTEEDI